jgi:beta-lactam-binding protein with PASTA domain
MTDNARLDTICAEYLERLRVSLGGLSAEDRRQILDQLSEHISSARAALPQQTEAAVREILERLGTPQEIAASAALEGDDPLPPHRRNPILIGVAVAVVLVVIVIGIAALVGAFISSTPQSGTILNPPRSSSTGTPVSTVAVPAITGQQLASATQVLGTLGLNYTVSYVASNQFPGTVVSQHPYGGARVDPASKVLLTVSGTQAALTIPNVIGQSQAQAEASLTAAGLDVQVVMKPGGSSTPGTVVDESPVAGSRVSPQSIVVLTVS